METLFQLDRPAAGARIVVAMSGGVDSSVVAALAARTGAEVIGVTLQLYDHGEATKRPGACCAGQDIRDARAVADKLGIAHYVFDHESRFRDSVIDRFADDYVAGRTPIPCVRCNMGVKFTDLGPFRAIRAGTLRDLAMADQNYGWTVEMQIKAAQHGIRCIEIPVSYRRRIGVSKVSGTVRGVIGAGTKILYVIGREALREFQTKPKPATARNKST